MLPPPTQFPGLIHTEEPGAIMWLPLPPPSAPGTSAVSLPSSPGLSLLLHCCGHALGIAVTQNGPTPQTVASNMPLQTLTLSQCGCSRSQNCDGSSRQPWTTGHGPAILTALGIGL